MNACIIYQSSCSRHELATKLLLKDLKLVQVFPPPLSFISLVPTILIFCFLLFASLIKFSDDYLIKPFTAKELIARVATHLELSRFRRELEYVVQERTATVKKNKQEGDGEGG